MKWVCGILPALVWIWYSLLIANVGNTQEFNAFKSYKEAKVKPPHYGKLEKRSHPMEEYLTGPQMRMMKHRKSRKKHRDSVLYHEKWSGFHVDSTDKRLLQQEEKEEHIINNFHPVNVQIETEFMRWSCLVFVIASFGWMIYMFLHRYYHSRATATAGLPAKSSHESGLDKQTEAVNRAV
mmetsp:Transcript_31785/g.53617  ORF Transcript_31785/g.53617 Transcript_31785/m.53617 type:complete len:180 (+) Transcript_31785:63-602(+)